jgi:hypothetical protein
MLLISNILSTKSLVYIIWLPPYRDYQFKQEETPLSTLTNSNSLDVTPFIHWAKESDSKESPNSVGGKKASATIEPFKVVSEITYR